MTVEFLIEDQGDGWWHCPTPLRAAVLDGPAAKFPPRKGARYPETYWLVRVNPPIEWNGDTRYAARWGPEHPLCHAIEPTSLALVMASSSWNGPIDHAHAGSVPIYPVLNAAGDVAHAEVAAGLGIKAGLSATDRTGPLVDGRS